MTTHDGRVVRASASRAAASGLIPSWVKPMTLKLVFTVSLLDAQHNKDTTTVWRTSRKFVCCAVGKGT